jgi:hypothetical protein
MLSIVGGLLESEPDASREGNSKRFEASAVLTDSDAASALEVACGSDASDQPVVSVCRFERTAVRGNDERLIRALWPLPSQQASEVSFGVESVDSHSFASAYLVYCV